LTTITNSTWILSDGQKDGWYDHGYVQYVGSSSSLPGNVLITYDYYNHSGEGPCTVNSYPANTTIYSYNSVIDGKQYSLSDCLDFRPKRVNGSSYLNFETAIFPSSAVNTEADVTYYLSRIDRLYVTADSRNFENPYSRLYVERGIESNNAITNESSADKLKLTIATFYIPPYAASSFDVKIVYEDSRRFTMNDIAKIQKATIQLNRTVKIHTIEIANLKNPVLNDNGDNLLKTGILIENFVDFSNADLSNGDFLCAFDINQGQCIPLFSGKDVGLELISASNYSVKDGIITQNYSEEIFTSQLEANNWVNPNPAGINDGRGRAKLGKKSSFIKNLLITAFMSFAALAVYYYLTTPLGIVGAINYAASTVVASAAEYYTAASNYIASIGVAEVGVVGVSVAPPAAAAYSYVEAVEFVDISAASQASAIPGVGWIIAAVIVIDQLTGGGLANEVKKVGDQVSDGLADLNDWVDSWF
jgi:hypothetical protein